MHEGKCDTVPSVYLILTYTMSLQEQVADQFRKDFPQVGDVLKQNIYPKITSMPYTILAVLLRNL